MTAAVAGVALLAGECPNRHLCCGAGQYLPGLAVAATAQRMACTPDLVRPA